MAIQLWHLVASASKAIGQLWAGCPRVRYPRLVQLAVVIGTEYVQGHKRIYMSNKIGVR